MSSKTSSTLSPDDHRYYDNPFQDYSVSQSNDILSHENKSINEHFKELLASNTKLLLERLEKNKKYWEHPDDYSIYTGTTGVAYTFYQYGKYFDKHTYVLRAIEMVQASLSRLKGKNEVTFLTGNAGPLALGAVIYHCDFDNEQARDDMVVKLKALSNHVIKDNSDLPDELLYGRAGYLYALLFVNANISPAPFDSDLIKQVIGCILSSGKAYSKARRCESPLMFSWYGKEYVGGAHGVAGILYLLLQARQYLTHHQLTKEILPCLKYLLKLRFTSGNFPSSIGSQSDKLVHWCHGAPSMTALFCLAYEIFPENQYLQAALDCGEVVWKRGLLKKGYGICHGVAGNAYTFLNLFQQTGDLKHLYRASKFAEWCMDYGTHETRSPDRPFSLFEGLAGTISFLIDLRQPLKAKFPGYTV